MKTTGRQAEVSAGSQRPATKIALAVALMLLLTVSGSTVSAQTTAGHESITDRSIDWPKWEQWTRLLLLRDYNTRVVVVGTALLGLASGMVGSFTLLRKRALMGDALSHATLPGIGLAFMIATAMGGEGKSLPVLLVGAAISGVLGMGMILFIRGASRIKEDAALGIVLSVFFGAGISLLSIVQQMPSGHAAGLEDFIYGKTASMTATDAKLIGLVGLAATVVCALLFKELKLLCFDESFAGATGLSVPLLDSVLMSVVVLVTIIGLQAVGLVLMIALLVVPAAAARFWTERMHLMTFASAGLGAVSAMIGSGMSALFPRLPSGAMIVIVATIFFLISMTFGPARGWLIRAIRRWRLEKKIRRQHLLRAIYELLESQDQAPKSDAKNLSPTVDLDSLLPLRSWSMKELRRLVHRAEAQGLVFLEPNQQLRLTPQGSREAARVVHEHRLWELFLITYADVAASQVDRDADAIEHVLDANMVRELEALLERSPSKKVPASPHPVF